MSLSLTALSYFTNQRLVRGLPLWLLMAACLMGSYNLPAPQGKPFVDYSRRSSFLRTHRLAVIVISCTFYVLLQAFNRTICHSDQVGTVQVPSGTLNPAYLVKAKHGAAATENLRCSQMGVDILQRGGNAIDAAVASTFCIGVVNMFSSGLGGGGFLIVRLPPNSPHENSTVVTINFREKAPALSNSSMYVGNPDAAKFGGLSVGVPGEVKGLYEAHSRWGSLPWNEVVEPSAKLASGWKVDRELGRRIPWFSDLFLNNPDWSSTFAPNGKLLQEGEIIRRTNLSRTLSAIAEHGPDAFYKGAIADAIVKKVRETGGILSHEDLLQYTVDVAAPVFGEYRGRRLYTTAAPSSGAVLLHMLNLAEKFDLANRDGLTFHRLIEAMKFGFAARTKIGDPFTVNDTRRIAHIPTKAFADEIVKNITDDRTHPPEYYNPEYDVKIDNGTSHISILDENGMAVAVTSTVNLFFGSAVLDPLTGIILNDEQDDFSTPGFPNEFGLWPSPYNYPEPGKRPLSSITPVIVENEDGSFYAALGGSGGSMIFGAVFQTLLNMLEWGMNPSAAIEHGRVHDQLYPSTTIVDDTLDTDVVNGLIKRGHNVTVFDTSRIAAVIQVVSQEQDGTIYAASDSRKNGIAAGY